MSLLGEVVGTTGAEDDQDYDFNQRREEFVKTVEQAGYEVVLPEPHHLQIDIDTDEQYEVFRKSAACLARNWKALGFRKGLPVVEEHPSKSGLPRRHITIHLPFEVTPWQRIAFQAALGSDPLRELLSAVRLFRGDEHPTLFVEKPDA